MKITQATTGHSSFSFAKKLAHVGLEISPGQIRALWNQGAPKQAADFVKWHAARKSGKHVDANLKQARLAKLEKQISILESQDASEKIALAKLRGEVVARRFVEQLIQAGGHAIFHELQRAFVHELPPLLAGASAETISQKNQEALAQASENLKAHFRSNNFDQALSTNENPQT
jgi:hypothetical protein